MGASIESFKAAIRTAGHSVQSPAGFQKAIWILAALAIFLRIMAILVVNDWRAPEDWEYGVIARNLLAGEGFSGSAWFVPEGPTAFMAPVYVWYLAAGFALLGDGAYLPLQLLQALAGGATAALVACMARRVLGSPAGVCAGLVFALNPTHAYLASQMHPLVFFTALVSATVWLALKCWDRPTPTHAALLGAVLGLAMLTDPSIAVFAPVLGCTVLLAPRPDWKRGVVLATITTAMACAIVAPWTLRNYLVFGDFVLVKSPSGLALWVGNHPGATGTQFTVDPDGRVVHAVDRMDPTLRARLHELGEPGAYKELGRAARAHMRTHPGETGRLMLRKAGYFWWYPTWLTDPHDARHPVLAQFRHPYKPVWALILVSALLGAASHRREWRRWAFLVTPLVCYTLLYAATNVGSNPRYRMPVEPVVMVFSGAAAARLAASSRFHHDKGDNAPCES